MAQRDHRQLKAQIYTWAWQCLTELRPILGEVPPCVSATIELLERMDDGPARPCIAFAGRFSAGKTALVNDILGDRVLMEGLRETTAIPTRVRKGESIRLLLKKSLNAWYEANEAEREQFLHLKASEVTPLLKRYLAEQEEALFEHPAMLPEIDVLDLPGVSSSLQNVENRALLSLRFANGVVWVANAKDGGLTRVDLNYLKDIPNETPRLVALTHMDLLPPSQRKSVLESAEREVAEIPNVVGVVGTQLGLSLTSDAETRPFWDKFLGAARRNSRLRPLIEEIVRILEGLRDHVAEEAAGETMRLLETLGLSPEAYSKFVSRLLGRYLRALGELARLSEVWGPASLAMSAIDYKLRMTKIYNQFTGNLKRALKHSPDQEGAGYRSIADVLLAYWHTTAAVFGGYVCAAFQAAASTRLGFQPPYKHGDMASSFDGSLWPDFSRDHLCEPLVEGYKSLLQDASHIFEGHPMVRDLYYSGRRMLNSRLLDRLGNA